jgi:hypothetical protein
MYWRKVERKDALKAFKKHARTEDIKNRIVAAEKAHAPIYLKRDPEHRPHAASWLNGERYLEAPEDTRPANGGARGAPPVSELPNAEDYLRERGMM